MANKYYFEALDKTLRDIMLINDKENNNKPFKGLTIVLKSVFRQILLVVPKGRRSDIIKA